MKSMIHSVILLFTLSFVKAAIAAPEGTPPDFSGTWKNQRGSLLVLQKNTANTYTGTFTTAVAKTKSCIGKPVLINAVSNHNALSINLSMATCGSQAVIAMTGLLNPVTPDTGTKMKTSNQKASNQKIIDMMTLTAFGGNENWASRVVTHDTFKPVHP